MNAKTAQIITPLISPNAVARLTQILVVAGVYALPLNVTLDRSIPASPELQFTLPVQQAPGTPPVLVPGTTLFAIKLGEPIGASFNGGTSPVGLVPLFEGAIIAELKRVLTDIVLASYGGTGDIYAELAEFAAAL